MLSRRKRKERETKWHGLLGQQWWQIPLWFRFRRESLNVAASRKLLRDLILDNSVSVSISAPYSLRDMVQRIASGAQRPIPIDYLCSELSEPVHTRGGVAFGSPGKYFDQFAQNYPDLHWWLSDKGLRMEIVGGNERVPSFDALAGHLMSQARSTRDPKYLSLNDYLVIAEELDKAGFLLREHLQGKYREVLAQWNQRHSGRTIKTFRDAIQAKQPRELWRGVRRRLYYAELKFRNVTPQEICPS
jgi:hypothetical protein